MLVLKASGDFELFVGISLGFEDCVLWEVRAVLRVGVRDRY